ncbi:hypothetical protein ACLOJK_016058 [Asimina triloba]
MYTKEAVTGRNERLERISLRYTASKVEFLRWECLSSWKWKEDTSTYFSEGCKKFLKNNYWVFSCLWQLEYSPKVEKRENNNCRQCCEIAPPCKASYGQVYLWQPLTCAVV